MHTLGDFAEKRFRDLLVRGVLGEIDGDEKLLSLLVDITDIYTTLVGEEDPISLKRKMSASWSRSRCDWHDQGISRRYVKSRSTKREESVQARP